MNKNQNDSDKQKNEGTANAKTNQGGHQQKSDTNIPDQGLRDDNGKSDSRNTSAQSSTWPYKDGQKKAGETHYNPNDRGDKNQTQHLRNEDQNSDKHNNERREEEAKTKRENQETELG